MHKAFPRERGARKFSGQLPGRPITCRLVVYERHVGRVILRPATSGDEAEFLDLVHASARLHHPWISLPTTPVDYQAYIRRYERPSEESLLVCLRGTGAIAGMVNINSIVRGRFQCGSVGYAAFAPTAGRGYMTEGLGLVVSYAFEQLRLHRLEASIQPDMTGAAAEPHPSLPGR